MDGRPKRKYKFAFTSVCVYNRLRVDGAGVVVENVKFGNSTLSFGRLRERIVLKCVPHVQHDYFSSFIQPIRSLFSGVVVAVAVVLAQAP